MEISNYNTFKNLGKMHVNMLMKQLLPNDHSYKITHIKLPPSDE